MTDMICRKTMMRCNQPGMCMPFGGCNVSGSLQTKAMTDKPDIRGYEVVWPQIGMEARAIDLWLPDTMRRTPPQTTTSINPLVRLADHEASRAADKARIAELEAALNKAREFIANQKPRTRTVGRQVILEDDMSKVTRVLDAIETALAQQGKEGGV